MKMLRFGSSILMIFLLSWLSIAGVYASDQWPKKRGTLCWEVSGSNGPAGTRTLRITNMGSNYYLLTGKFTTTDGKTAVVNGNAEMSGDSILMTLTAAGGNNVDSMRASIVRVVLDKTTLDGTQQAISMIYGTDTTGISSVYGTGTVTLTSCP